MEPEMEARFWSFVGEADEHGCRIWNGPTNVKGLPLFVDDTISHLAIPTAFTLARGPVTNPHYEVQRDARKCSNVMCVEPTHLFPGKKGTTPRGRKADAKTA